LSLTALVDYHFALEDGRLVLLYPHGRAIKRVARANVVRLDDVPARRAHLEILRDNTKDERH
jgi:hypothetical protein